jgi:hypothetical protein
VRNEDDGEGGYRHILRKVFRRAVDRGRLEGRDGISSLEDITVNSAAKFYCGLFAPQSKKKMENQNKSVRLVTIMPDG